MNRFDLFDAMVNGRTVTIVSPSGMTRVGKIMSIQMEDGSGYSFNLVMSNQQYHTMHVYYRCPK